MLEKNQGSAMLKASKSHAHLWMLREVRWLVGHNKDMLTDVFQRGCFV